MNGEHSIHANRLRRGCLVWLLLAACGGENGTNPSDVQVSVALNNAACTSTRISAAGTASGVVGAELYAAVNGSANIGSSTTCSDWSPSASGSNRCQRREGQAVTTQWSYGVSGTFPAGRTYLLEMKTSYAPGSQLLAVDTLTRWLTCS